MAAPGEVCGLSTTRLRNPPSRDGRFSSELRFMLLSGGPLWRAPRFQIHKVPTPFEVLSNPRPIQGPRFGNEMRFQNALSYTSYHGRPAEGRRGSDMGAPASPATVVESIDDEESDRWKAMADAFDFGGLSDDDDDDDGTSGDDRGGTRNDYTRRGDDDAEAPSTSQRRGRTAGASRLLPVRWLESRCVGSVDAADRGSFPGVEADPSTPAEGAAADKIDAGAEANEELAARFAGEYRSTEPFLTRRVAETWMTRSALGRRGARGALEAGQAGDAGASEVKTSLLFSRDNSNFLGRGGMCDRTDDVPFREAWSHVAAHAAGRTGRRCYFRAPLAVELRRGIDFTAASAVFGAVAEAKTKANAKAVKTDQSSAPPPPFSERTSSVWVSSPGCVTPLHFDLCHGLLTQLSGTKRVLLVAPEHSRSLHRNPPSHANPNSSPVDLPLWLGDASRDEDVVEERRRHPRVANIVGEVYECVLTPGDTLYIPPFWWHHVATLGEASTSLLLAFDPTAEESVHPCVED